MLLLLKPRYFEIRNRLGRLAPGDGLKTVVLALLGLFFWAFLFAVSFKVLSYFRSIEGLGDLLAIAAGVFYAGYFIVTERGRQKLDTLSYVWLVDLIAAITLLLITLGMKMPLTGYPTQSWRAFLGAALVSQVGGYLSIGYALGHLPASIVSPTLIGQPVVTALLAIPLLGEALRTEQALGGIVVLAGIYLVHRSREGSAPAELAATGI